MEETRTVIDRAEAAHNQFVKRPKSQKNVVSWAAQVGEEEITDFPVNGDIFLTPHESFPAGPDDLRYLLMRWDGIISESLNQEIWQLWKEFKASDYKIAKKKRNLHRDPTPVIHCGAWSHYSKKPYLTRDSRPVQGQQALDNLLQVIRQSLAPVLTARLKLYDIQAFQCLESYLIMLC
ncbi:hypothetical protein M422DRAFT_57076 [Sphaerobolus stellatus SS14]|uniref:Uncharacterized protein n=1 Tax=Sphaerobolus stellatus (strain SS14) TaxID=990650 RepID=A0A0C9TLK1_SPHS4|nr:hypothetical protein M422DRAFT_57076 [Sphaerobolus stellatus SS14]